MTLKEHYQKNFSLAYPVVLSQLGHIMVSVADSVMVGQLGAVPLASVSLAISVFTLFMLFGIGASYGMTPLVATADGANDKRAASGYLKNGLVVSVFIGVVLVLLCLGAVIIFPYLGQEEGVLEGAIPFFKVLALGLLPLMLFQAFRQFAEGLSMTKQAMYISVASNVLNVLLNWVLIFGHWGFEPMGMLGAAVSTLISRVIMVFAMGGFVLLYPKFVRYRAVYGQVTIAWGTIKKILKIGVPTGLQFVFEIGAFSASAIMIGWLGAIPLAAHQIAMNLSAITYMTATGIAAAASIRVGNQLGRKDYLNLRTAGVTCFVMTIVLMAVYSFTFVVGRFALPELYVDNEEVIALASGLLVVVAFYQISDGIQTVGLGVLRGLGDVKIPTIVTLIAYWGIAIPFGYVCAFVLGMKSTGVWVGLSVGLTLAAVAHVMRFRKLTKRLTDQTQ
ncbi:MATE family efflux transporter [Reichenbachiella sp. MSK19-1]|uniref:MATE family efflux transporter n=1 Tax=Reichenbachiella sp. MSK19-1 TaxID=1897631 RepID=UPI000E6D1E02|nr:MATE family efflux transporter [Reichenbachiella sp. MSK19-1]RJE74804.1 MATE family efflux transporter [Reichenbachiella sp. MSK19-1]